jgi:adenine-specific DNA-methyltransferase
LSEILEGTSIDKKVIEKLGRLLVNDRESLVQLLLSFCSSDTFKRIINCPTYPSKIATIDLPYRKNLLNESLKGDPCEIAFALGYLYEVATGKNYRKIYGQFFTPYPVALQAINRIAIKNGEILVDPGCGTAVFPATLFQQLNRKYQNIDVRYLGVENSPLLALISAVSLEWFKAPKEWKILYSNFIGPKIRNEITDVIGEKIDAIISNPPFIRYHNLGKRKHLRQELDLIGSSGLHSYFLARSAAILHNGRMLFVVPPEMKATRYGSFQLEQLEKKFTQHNEVIFFDQQRQIWDVKPTDQITLDMHSKIRKIWAITFFENQFLNYSNGPLKKKSKEHALSKIAKVHRGISTGANEFFVLTSDAIKNIGITESRYITKVMPTRIAKLRLGTSLDLDEWNNLEKEGRACWLLTVPSKRSIDSLPIELRNYLLKGKGLAIHETPTSKSREPWYSIKLPERPPDMFFTYIARGVPHFVYNKAKVFNLTNLLGVYLNESLVNLSEEEICLVVQTLNEAIKDWCQSQLVGRRYRGGIVKLEPRDLEMMPIPKSLADKLKNISRLKQLFQS